MSPTDKILKIHRGENSSRPPGDGTRGKNFKSKIWPGCRGLPVGDLSISQAHLTLSLDVPLAGRGGAMSGPQRLRFIFPKIGPRRLLGAPVLPAGEVGQGKTTAPLEKPAGTPLPIIAGLRVLRLPSQLTSGRRGIGMPESWGNLTFRPNLCYFAIREKNWLREEDRFGDFHRAKNRVSPR